MEERTIVMRDPLCNIEVLIGHTVGIVGGQFPVATDQRFVGVYQFETACGSFICCLLDGDPVYFEAEKVKIMGMSNRYYPESDGGDCWVGSYVSRQPKTYYVVDSKGGDPIDCKSWKAANELAQEMNQGLSHE